MQFFAMQPTLNLSRLQRLAAVEVMVVTRTLWMFEKCHIVSISVT